MVCVLFVVVLFRVHACFSVVGSIFIKNAGWSEDKCYGGC